MLDVEAVILAELEQLASSPAPDANWSDVLARAGESDAPRRASWRRLLVLAAAGVLAVVVVAAALAATFGGFTAWLSGEPGKPAPSSAQNAFARSTRSWKGFPSSAQLRQLIETRIGRATYTLYGFRGSGSFCLRLIVTGDPSGTEFSCAPLEALRSRRSPVLVLASDAAIGETSKLVTQGPLALPAAQASVSFGVVADGVDRVELVHREPASTRVTVFGNAFLSVSPGLSPFNTTSRITASDGRTRASVPFAPAATPFGHVGATALPSAAGPSQVQRLIHGGAIRWFASRQPRGEAVSPQIHHIVGVLPDVIFARMVAPAPTVPERIVVSIRPAGNAYFGGRLRNKLQVCAELVGGRYAGGGCWPAGRLFTTAPFSWSVAEQQGGQVVAVSGLASDDIARLTLFSATGAKQAVPLHDNTYLAIGSLAEYPLRLVAYDQLGRIIGIKTFKGDYAQPVASSPAPNAPWRQVLKNGAGSIYLVRSTTGGICVGFRFSSGAANVSCDQPVAPTALSIGTSSDANGSYIYGRSGSGIARVTIRFSDGRFVSVDRVHGYLLRQLPRSSTNDRSLRVVAVAGFDAKGRAVAHLTFRR